MLRSQLRISRSVTTDIVASGLATPNLRFQPDVHKKTNGYQVGARRPIFPPCGLTLIVYNIGRADGTYIRIFIYVHRVKTRCYHIGRRAATMYSLLRNMSK